MSKTNCLYSGKGLQLNKLDNGFVEMLFDLQGESVNKFCRAMFEDLDKAITLLQSDSSIRGLLASSNKSVFFVGADISEFGSMFSEGGDLIQSYLDRINAYFSAIEDLPFPTVAAVNGYCLGGGMEFALSCDYRVLSEDAKIGLPETKLGIIPGWGGTVRLPRLAGVDVAVEWIAGGKENPAHDALNAKIADAVVTKDTLRATALKVLAQAAEGKLNYAQRREQKKSPLPMNDTEALMAFETSKMFVKSQAGYHYPAPVAAIQNMQDAMKMSRDEALKVEGKTFVAMASTPVAFNLVGLFMSDQLIAKKAKDWEKKSDKKIGSAAVLGAGIMGGGIAYQSAYKGVPIKMKDIAQSGIDLGLSEAAKLLNKRVERGRMSAAEMAEVLTRIDPMLSFDNFDAVDIVVEAVVENAKVKHAVLKDVESQVKDDTIICSNTSTISISSLAEVLERPQNFCGMHFFNPVHRMPLVEVIRGEKTSDQAVARTVAYANALGKKAIVVNDCPGFLVNRVLFPYFAGFIALLRDGADFQQIDKVMERWGWPMGPAYLMDVVGVDTGVHAENVMAQGFPDRMSRDFKGASDILFEAGRFGQKNGKGFYQYQNDKKGKPQKLVDEDTYALLAPHCAEKREFTEEEIVARMMLPMATEMARCLEENIVGTVAEADMALIYGLGFPPFRGGIFRWMDSEGLQKIVSTAENFEKLGAIYQPTEGMKKLAADNATYYTV